LSQSDKIPRSKSPVLPISLFDICLGSGRTIRKPTGPSGFSSLQVSGKTDFIGVCRRASGQKNSGEKPKAAGAKSSNIENDPSGSKHSSKKEDTKSSSKKDDNKSSSKKDDKKSDSKPSKAKAAGANTAGLTQPAFTRAPRQIRSRNNSKLA
ncbi:hypothetical protein KCU93_g9788, partial [Aureobasidium melanogenum]